MVLLTQFSHSFVSKATCRALWVRCWRNVSLSYVDEPVLLYRPTIFTKVIGNCYTDYHFCHRNMTTGDLMSWACVKKKQFYFLLWIFLSTHECVFLFQGSSLYESLKYNILHLQIYLRSLLILPHNLLKSASGIWILRIVSKDWWIRLQVF